MLRGKLTYDKCISNYLFFLFLLRVNQKTLHATRGSKLSNQRLERFEGGKKITHGI